MTEGLRLDRSIWSVISSVEGIAVVFVLLHCASARKSTKGQGKGTDWKVMSTACAALLNRLEKMLKPFEYSNCFSN